MRVVLAGGGTAGHIEPALALADALRQADSGIEVTCLGTERGLETRLVPLRGYELALIPAVPLPRSVTPKLLTVPGRLACATITAWIVVQAVVNIGAVIGVLPITGVPLPLVSRGLSSVLVTMVGLGMLMSFARREPGASQALAMRGPSVGARVLSWLRAGTRRGT